MKKHILLLLAFLTLRSAIYAQTTLPPEMVFVEGGVFTMGCTPEQVPDCLSDEFPPRIVRISSFEIGKYEVTQALWTEVMGANNPPNNYNDPQKPMNGISTFDCATFCNKLSVALNLKPVYYFDNHYSVPFDSLVGDSSGIINVFIDETANGYRLPTEAEWEYAARGGVGIQTKFSGSNDYNLVAWCKENTIPNEPRQVGLKNPNSIGVYDMSGNIGEFVLDYYNFFGYEDICMGTPHPIYFRGGNFSLSSIDNRIPIRYNYFPVIGLRFSAVGFRLARNTD